eukprot:CAMPEP_0115708526 /NCGR_PEP_ID=MMETSP0272-20121206/71960_1 /TAXON_ID=71861 /ORGANISM="Scrippsiella trochoidea, Strain CCMP3099" /LENGTH=58 /DNA_ID=CAMNT_0003150025 /DNA_START=138 /DNA_END=310 /DNA_ORIENTATION=+
MFSPTALPPDLPYIVLLRPPSRQTSGFANFASFFSHLEQTITSQTYHLKLGGDAANAA